MNMQQQFQNKAQISNDGHSLGYIMWLIVLKENYTQNDQHHLAIWNKSEYRLFFDLILTC